MEKFKLDVRAFHRAIVRVKYAASADHAFTPLRGVCIRDKFVMATDGHRVAIAQIVPITGSPDLTLSLESLALISRVYKTGEIEICVSSDGATATQDGKIIHIYQLFASTLSLNPQQKNEYPEVFDLLPKKIKYRGLLKKKVAIESLNIIRKINALTGSSESCYLLSRNNDSAVYASTCTFCPVPLKVQVGEGGIKGSFKIKVNPKYIIDALKGALNKEAVLKFYGEEDALGISGKASNHYVMPLRF